MSAETRSRVLSDYLGRVRAELPIGRGRDILLELESSIRDRVDDIAAASGREPDDEMLARALKEMGDPEHVAGAFGGDKPLLPTSALRPFIIYTSLVFAAHLALVGVATTIGQALQFGPLSVGPVGPHGVLSVAAVVVHALFLDVGMMVFAFLGAGALRRPFAPKPLSVDATRRAAAGRIALTVLVAALLNVYRDDLFVVVSDHVSYPLFSRWFVAVLPLIDVVLAFAVLTDALYFWLGERRLTLAVDAAHGAAGLAATLYILRCDAVLTLPTVPALGAFVGPVDDFLGRLGSLVIGFMALVFAVKTVRRAIRFAQI